MADLLSTFRQRTEDLISAINDRGGIRATLESVRRQMAEADRRRALAKVRADLKRLEHQITEMITAVGVQAVGQYKGGQLHSPELEPLCQHIVELESSMAQQSGELARLEAQTGASQGQAKGCAACGKPLPDGATFCPYCGAAAPKPQVQFCAQCGTALREGARFCAHCGSEAAKG
jgi:RNA polymerase subunit RPABC4/transcription elongation factor Spt4